MKAFCDASFLVSLYTPDANTAKAIQQCSRGAAGLAVTPLAELEVVNALQLRLFRRELTQAEVTAAGEAFRRDLADGVYTSFVVSLAIYEKARSLSRKHTSSIGCRSLDILHVAAALVMRADILYTFDDRQKSLAKLEGLLAAP